MLKLKHGEKISDIAGYEGIYAVTTRGRVWSYRRRKWLMPFTSGNGYSVVTLSIRAKEVDKKVHRLVGEAFIPNPDNKPQINHKNGIKKDCRLCNLEWVTARENLQHASDNGLNKVYKFTYIEKLLICKMNIILKVKQVYLARLFEVSPPAISYIIKTYRPLIETA
jgi:hypothetical protein